MPAHPAFIGGEGLAGCVLVGLLAGGISALLTAGVYASEDAFARLPIHWMWWPAIGGLVIGVGGLFFPQALGSATTSSPDSCRATCRRASSSAC